MIEGRSVVMAIEKSGTRTTEYQSRRPFNYAGGRPETAGWTERGITVRRLGEGFWGNGGWVLEGGLLDMAMSGSTAIELYGKAVIRRSPYIPFPFHRPIPNETGYEFFLLLRPARDAVASIIRRWEFGPDEVVVESRSLGETLTEVKAALVYDAESQVATVTIDGLKRPFIEQVGLASALQTKQ
jgi:hypothetical protein